MDEAELSELSCHIRKKKEITKTNYVFKMKMFSKFNKFIS